MGIERSDLERLKRQAARVFNHARDMARSGAHTDHKSIIPHLESLDGFAFAHRRLQDRAFRAQLDRLCAMARAQVDSPGPRGSDEHLG